MPGIYRDKILDLKNSRGIFGKVIFSISLFFWSTFKFFTNPRYRSEQISRIQYSNKIIQVSTFTKENRYPELFKQIVEELKDIKNPKILSFGCSTGEEVFSLKQIISNAEIIGVDINRWCLKTASKNNLYSDCQFIHASKEIWKKKEYYDCILSLAVFQKTIHRNPNREFASQSFSYHDFEENIDELNNLLKLKGIMVLDHSDYHFSDLELFRQKYISRSDSPIKRQRPTFNKSNLKVSSTSLTSRIFRKNL